MKQKGTIADPLRAIPGVGPSIAEDLRRLGIKKVTCLKGKDPEKLYLRFCAMEGHPVDRCLLYVFRCAVYYASNDRHDPELLKWWNWADKKQKAATAAAGCRFCGKSRKRPFDRASAGSPWQLRARNQR